ncbi:MAG: DUF3098 domain-containing protein [Bacteroidia bacterium]|jgi:hypothetical protein|nr:DUF3098 domain-containing protein [Bacteroidia bacterium]
MQKTNVKKQADKSAVTPKAEQFFLFGKTNYTLMIIGIILIVTGFYLMAGTDDIFSTTKLTVAPIFVMLGLAVEIAAIMWKKKD